jgi:transcriptional/translational regulatory protein YebC/TACO1
VEGEAFEKLMRLVEVLEDDDDVQSVTTNMETSEEAMAAYAAS